MILPALDIKNLIEFGRYAEDKDAHMILNHKAAIELPVDDSDLIGFAPIPSSAFTVSRLKMWSPTIDKTGQTAGRSASDPLRSNAPMLLDRTDHLLRQ
ncbi:MAG: hypothetical protein OEL57_09075 [Trichlorobacter sp.]|uniref:hypothetical protein n=1 Tax=Trichlorobacter sp. TaxID=2911007 RepID=UPI002562C9D6|nr:hypothetical protein [Trichlorobacter sp.]MDK9718042.1 hypothetical protein [Trichlorobacter sp.]